MSSATMLRGLIAFAIASLLLAQEGKQAPLSTREKTAGVFVVRGSSFRVVLKSAQIVKGGVVDPDFGETVTKVEIRDHTGGVVFERAFPYSVADGRFEDSVAVHPEFLKARGGGGLLLTYSVLPSTPLGGQSWQLFGVVNGRLVPFSAPISVEGDLASSSSKGKAAGSASASWDDAAKVDLLEFRVWTGNFFVIVPLRINWVMATVKPYRCLKMTDSGPAAVCRYRVEAERVPEEGLTFVRLFPQADEKTGAPLHAVVKKDSKIEFLEAEGALAWDESESGVGLGVSGEIWLKVRIDGKEGWIHSQEDLLAIGLPQAG